MADLQQNSFQEDDHRVISFGLVILEQDTANSCD